MPRNIRERRVSSSDSSESESEQNTANEIKESDTKKAVKSNEVSVKEKIEELKFVQKQRQRTHGLDVYSLAIGESAEFKDSKDLSNLIENDPWKIRTGGLVDMKRIKEKRGNEIVKSMHSNFAKETNQRDEDAEMQKFIEEHLRKKKEEEAATAAAKAATAESSNSDASISLITASSNVKLFKKPEDALFDVPKYLIENHSKNKSEESMSEQMLSGIPEVDLGVEERIRNIEETERAKQKVNNLSNISLLTSAKTEKTLSSDSLQQQYAPQNQSVNFVQHKRFDDALINPDHMIKLRLPRPNTLNSNLPQQPVVGDAPKHKLLQQQPTTSKSADSNSIQRRSHNSSAHSGKHNARRKYYVSTNANEPESSRLSSSGKRTHTSSSNTTTDRASDDYCLERFKKNMRFNRNSKIKIA